MLWLRPDPDPAALSIYREPQLSVDIPAQEPLASIITDLETLAGVSPDHKALKKSLKYLKKAQKEFDKGNLEKAYKQALKTTDKLLDSQDPPVPPLRQRLDHWIRWLALSLPIKNEEQDDD